MAKADAPEHEPWSVRSDRNLRITVVGLWSGFAVFAAGSLAVLAWLMGLW